MNIPQIFKNPVHQSKFDRQGFFVLPDFLTAEEIKHMDVLFDELHPELPSNGFFSGSYSSDFNYKRRVCNEIKKLYHRAYEENFINYTSFGGAFLVKMPSENSDLFIHQDWTVVDETKEVALNIWIPLCDITEENGPLMVIPGSHFTNYQTLRAPTLRHFFDHDIETAMQQLEPIIVKAGTAVVLNQSIVHYSPANTSKLIRKAITSGIKTKNAKMIFHFSDKEIEPKQIEKFEMDEEFFIQFDDFFTDIYKRPEKGKSLGKFQYSVPMLSGEELKDKFRSMRVSAGYPPINSEINYKTAEKESGFLDIYSPKNILLEIIARVKKQFK